MELREFEAPTLEEAKNKAYAELGDTEEILYTTEEKKGKLLKKGSFIVRAIKTSDVADFLKESLTELLKNMDIDVKIETSVRSEQINLKMYSDKNNILIGHNGQTLVALQGVLRQQVFKEIGIYPYILLDVENYKEKKIYHLEHNAKKIAHEVQKTKVDVRLDDMNSYERRLIHNALSNFKNISTTSEGEEPHRHVVISYVESKEDE